MKMYKRNNNESLGFYALGNKLETLIFIHFHTNKNEWQWMKTNEKYKNEWYSIVVCGDIIKIFREHVKSTTRAIFRMIFHKF